MQDAPGSRRQRGKGGDADRAAQTARGPIGDHEQDSRHKIVEDMPQRLPHGVPPTLGGKGQRRAMRYFGDITIVICRPSIRGICSTLAIS